MKSLSKFQRRKNHCQKCFYNNPEREKIRAIYPDNVFLNSPNIKAIQRTKSRINLTLHYTRSILANALFSSVSLKYIFPRTARSVYISDRASSFSLYIRPVSRNGRLFSKIYTHVYSRARSLCPGEWATVRESITDSLSLFIPPRCVGHTRRYCCSIIDLRYAARIRVAVLQLVLDARACGNRERPARPHTISCGIRGWKTSSRARERESANKGKRKYFGCRWGRVESCVTGSAHESVKGFWVYVRVGDVFFSKRRVTMEIRSFVWGTTGACVLRNGCRRARSAFDVKMNNDFQFGWQIVKCGSGGGSVISARGM